jgi:hypothetical protein
MALSAIAEVLPGTHRVVSFPLHGGFDERDTIDHLCCGVGCSRDHSILRRRNVDYARKHEAGLSGSDCFNRDPVSDWRIAWLGSATGITCWTDSAELAEQSQHYQIAISFICVTRSSR